MQPPARTDHARRSQPVDVHPSSPPRRLAAIAARRPFTSYLVLVFAPAYPVMSLPILASHGVIPGGSIPGRLHLDAEELAGLLLVLFAVFPAAVVMTWLTEGHPGLLRLRSRMMRWRIGVAWWLVVLVGLPVLTVGFSLLLGDSWAGVDVVDVVVGQTVALLANFVFVNLWEESAWAGFLQTRLERGHRLWVAALLTAVPFAFAHAPLKLIGDFSAGSVMGGLVGYLVLGALMRLMVGVVLRGAADSLLAVGLLHSVFNRINNDNGITAELTDGDARMLGALLATIVLTVAVAVVARRRLGRDYRRPLDTT